MVCQWQQWSVGGRRGYGLLGVTNGLSVATTCPVSVHNGLLSPNDGLLMATKLSLRYSCLNGLLPMVCSITNSKFLAAQRLLSCRK